MLFPLHGIEMWRKELHDNSDKTNTQMMNNDHKCKYEPTNYLHVYMDIDEEWETCSVYIFFSLLYLGGNFLFFHLYQGILSNSTHWARDSYVVSEKLDPHIYL